MRGNGTNQWVTDGQKATSGPTELPTLRIQTRRCIWQARSTYFRCSDTVHRNCTLKTQLHTRHVHVTERSGVPIQLLS